MAGGTNLAVKYAGKVDERFSRESQAQLALSSEYEFMGAGTVKVYSIPVSAMTDYSRSGTARYGTPSDLARNVQTLTVTKDRAFTFIIDKGDKIQAQMVSDAGKALSRQVREVCIPEYDAYVFSKLAAAATARGNIDTTAIDKTNAYSLFLKGQERLGNNSVPDAGRVAFCSYAFANFLRLDSAFIKYGDMAQEMLAKGVIGEVDGVKIVKVPSWRLPAGCAFILTHPSASTAPKQLEDYKIHDNPPGISGWLVEGRFIYDCFVLSEKAGAVYYHGSQAALKGLNVLTAGTGAGKTSVIVTPDVTEAPGNARYYVTAENAGELTAVTYNAAITPANWTVFGGSGSQIIPTAGHTCIRIVEVGSDNKPVSCSDGILNIG